MASLVYLADAKRHLRIVGEDQNTDVAMKVSQATTIVMNYLGDAGNDSWTPATVPGPIQAATLMLLAHLYENRGDDMKTDEWLWNALHRYLLRYRTPALA